MRQCACDLPGCKFCHADEWISENIHESNIKDQESCEIARLNRRIKKLEKALDDIVKHIEFISPIPELSTVYLIAKRSQ